ncbi:MAG: hypothetical protein JW917_02595 [Ignavibacteria bacterium]|nr:hypothetical protein [Ignavibacteria bacterium]
MKKYILIIFTVVILFVSQSYAQDTISSKDAANHIGDTVFVKGKVAAIYDSRGGNTFINFDYDFPDVTFIAFKYSGTDIDLNNIKEGCILTVFGVIENNGEFPMIILNSAAQITPITDE